MVQSVTDESGNIHDFPDEATHEQMLAAIKGYSQQNNAYSFPLDTITRQAGLIGRAAVEGATALPTAMANIPAFVGNNVRSGADWLAGVEPSSPSISYVNPFSEGLTAMGTPTPQGTWENREQAVLQPLFGVGSGIAAGASSPFASILAKNPALQYQAAEGGSIAGEIAKEADLSPHMQFLASLLGSVVTPGAISGTKGIIGAFSPFTKQGKDTIAANVLATFADDPQKAANNLRNAPEYVKDSPQTAGTASGDNGLLQLERSLSNKGGFADTYTAQNKARTNLLAKVAGTPADIEKDMVAREKATAPAYSLAKIQPINAEAISPVLDKIDAAINEVGAQSNTGKYLLSYKNKIKAALPDIKQIDTGILDSSGNPIQRDVTKPIPQSQITQIYREERDNLQAKSLQDNYLTPSVKAYLQPINHDLGQAIESQSPLFAQAQQKYREMSIPISQKQTMQDIVKGIQGTAQDAEGNYYLLPGKAATLMKNGEVNTDYKGWQKLEDALSPEQYNALINVQKDISRSNMINNPGIKPLGADTYKNLASGNAIRTATGGALKTGIPGLGKILPYDKANDAIIEHLTNVLQDPEKARQLLLMGRKDNPTFWRPLMRNTGLATMQGATQANH